jgi:2-aminoethylphosphonate-pyruvate transaminase
MATREWVLLNPGPGNTTRAVREALVTPDLCHREPEFFRVMRECRAMLARLAGGETPSPPCFTGSGTAAVEAALCSVIPRDRAVLIVDNGVYGKRMVKMAEAHGVRAEVMRYDIFTPARPADVEARLLTNPDVSHVAIVHHETTTGLLNPVVAAAEVVARHGRRLIVDATSSCLASPLTSHRMALTS